MLKQYIQLSEPIEIAPVVDAMKRGEKSFPVVNKKGVLINVSISSLRMLTYTKGTSCVTCNKEAHFFMLERMRNDKSKGHLNLYHRREDGSLVMMTSDHIIAKSRGGSDHHLDNRQPMCCYCNFRKGNLLPGETPKKKERELDNSPSRARGHLKMFIRLFSHLSNGMPLEKFWEIRADLLGRLLRMEHKLSEEEKVTFRKVAMIG